MWNRCWSLSIMNLDQLIFTCNKVTIKLDLSFGVFEFPKARTWIDQQNNNTEQRLNNIATTVKKTSENKHFSNFRWIMLFQNAYLEHHLSKRSSCETAPVISIYNRGLISWGRTALQHLQIIVFFKKKQALLIEGPHRVQYSFTSVGWNICRGRFSITPKC